MIPSRAVAPAVLLEVFLLVLGPSSARAEVFGPPVADPSIECVFNTTHCYVEGEYHTAIDYRPASGLTIRAAGSGIVTVLVRNGTLDHGLGNTVILKHALTSGGTIYTMYSHLKSIALDLAIGGRVAKGHVLGVMGGTGYGLPSQWDVHLHFEVKDAPVLDNPSGSGTYYGYTPSSADLYGYHDPASYIGVVAVAATSLTTTALEITPTAGPYYPGDVIHGAFVVTNGDATPVVLDQLTISGRGPGGDSDVLDFPAVTGLTVEGHGSYSYSADVTLPRSGRYRFVPACQVDGAWQSLLTTEGARIERNPIVAENLALGRPCYVTTNGADDGEPGAGMSLSDIVDGSLAYQPASWGVEDGCVGWANNDYSELMRVKVAIDLERVASVSRVRYNMGDCQRADTWGADAFTSPLGSSGTVPGGSYAGAWTTHEGSWTGRALDVTLDKTRTDWANDWLFIGEIEAWGIAPGAMAVQTSDIRGANNAHTDAAAATGAADGDYVSLGAYGGVVLDLGVALADRDGSDFRVVVADTVVSLARAGEAAILQTSPFGVYGSQDGWNWTLIGTAAGTAEFDLLGSGLDSVRFVQILDTGADDSLSTSPGADIDAIETDWVTSSLLDVGMPAPRKSRLRLAIGPNPARGDVSFTVCNGEAGEYVLEVLDVQGRLRYECQLNLAAESQCRVRWSPSRPGGAGMAPGVYLVRVRGRHEARVQRLVVLE